MGDNKNEESTSGVSNTSLASSLMTRIMSNAKFAVEIFDMSGHFGMWQAEVLDVLFQQGLDIAIEENKPDNIGEGNSKTINRVACGTIRSYLAREQKYPYTKETSAGKLWNALEDKYLKKNGQNKLYMKKRVLRFTYVPVTTMNDHITNFNKLATDLQNMDVTFSDGDMTLMLLSSLPDEYEHLETTILYGNDEVSLKKVCSALYNYEQRKREKQKSGEGEALESKGLKVVAENGVMRICSGALVVMKGIRRNNNMYHYRGSTVIGTATATSSDDKEAEATKLWHMRLGHAGGKFLKILSDQGLLKGVKTCNLEFCEYCVKGKQTRVKFGTSIHNTKGILDYVHSDIWGASKTPSLGGKHYFVTFIDDFSRRVWVYTIKTKDEVLRIFLKWKAMIETQTGRKIKAGLPTRECGPSCQCGSECGNRLTQKGVSAKLKVVKDRIKGWSLVAADFTPKGKFICEYTGELLTTEEARNRQKLYDKISKSSRFPPALLVVKEHLPSGNVCMRINIDATRIGNIARFINHSCDGGNLCTMIVRSSGALLPRVCFFSSRDILENEELSFSYGDTTLNLTGSQCFCGSACCSGILPSEHT